MSVKPSPELAFSELMNTKFCHDLAGPISALNNGLEFLAEDDSDREIYEQAMDLLQLSAKEAFARLQMYRVCYGVVSRDSESALSELIELVGRYFEFANITLEWKGEESQSPGLCISHEFRRVLTNAILLVSGFLVYGGEMTIDIQKQGSRKTVKITGKADKIKDDPILESIIQGKAKEDDITTRNSTAFFLLKLLDSMGRKMSFKRDDTLVELELT